MSPINWCLPQTGISHNLVSPATWCLPQTGVSRKMVYPVNGQKLPAFFSLHVSIHSLLGFMLQFARKYMNNSRRVHEIVFRLDFTRNQQNEKRCLCHAHLKLMHIHTYTRIYQLSAFLSVLLSARQSVCASPCVYVCLCVCVCVCVCKIFIICTCLYIYASVCLLSINGRFKFSR